MTVQAMGYFWVGTSKLDDWTSLATGQLGLQPVDRGGAMRAFRMDDRKQRLIVDGGLTDGERFFGWEVADAAALDALAARLEKAGVAVRRETAAVADQRCVAEVISFHDPAGNRVEAFHGGQVADEPFRPSRHIAGFRTGTQGVGHAVLMMPEIDAALTFYRDLLGFRITDFMGPPVSLYFMHVNTRHHSLAIAHGPRNRMHHLMMEFYSLDDVGQSYDIAQQEDRVVVKFGRHPNDLMTSFYMRTPSEFLIEHGWGGREVGPDWQPSELTSAGSFWGHQGLFESLADGPPPPMPAAEPNHAPLQVIDGNYERMSAAAQSNLGIMYERGKGVSQDYTQAVEWYRKAADRGNAVAQNNLGVIYEGGQGVPQDYTQAVEWYRRAADQGSASAKENLARLRIPPASKLPDTPPQQSPTQLQQPQTQQTIAAVDAKDRSPAELDSEKSYPSSVEQSRRNEQSGSQQPRSKIDDFAKTILVLGLVGFVGGAIIFIKIGIPKLPVRRSVAEQSFSYIVKNRKSVAQRARDLALGSMVPIIKELMSRDWRMHSTPQSERDALVEQNNSKALSDRQFEGLLAKIVSDEYAVGKNTDHPDPQEGGAAFSASHQSPMLSEDQAKSREKSDLGILTAPQGAIVDHLDHLAKLHASGALSDEEFKELKTRLIFRMDEGRVGPFCSRRIDYPDRA